MGYFLKTIKLILLSFLIFELAAFILVSPAQAANVEVPILGEKKFYDTSKGMAIGEYVADIYKFAIGAVGIIAAVVLMYGGVLWIAAGGSQEKVGEAKAWIGAALTGLFLFMTSYLILNLINPNLLKFQAIKPVKVEAILTGSCRIASISTAGSTASDECYDDTNQDDCIKTKKGTWTQGGSCPDRGCCTNSGGGTGRISSCDDGISKESCTGGNYKYYEKTRCEDLSGCNQYCKKVGDYKDCSNNGKKGICVSGSCDGCEETPGDTCSIISCCAGMCCNSSGINRCQAGEPTNGKYCN